MLALDVFPQLPFSVPLLTATPSFLHWLIPLEMIRSRSLEKQMLLAEYGPMRMVDHPSETIDTMIFRCGVLVALQVSLI